MWVRSQNKKFLGCYDSFSVSESGIIIGYQGHIVHLGLKNLITQFVFEMPIEINKEVTK